MEVNNNNSSTEALVPDGARETKISDFEILQTIGTGTFARVYLCRPRGKDKTYFALKVSSKTRLG